MKNISSTFDKVKSEVRIYLSEIMPKKDIKKYIAEKMDKIDLNLFMVIRLDIRKYTGRFKVSVTFKEMLNKKSKKEVEALLFKKFPEFLSNKEEYSKAIDILSKMEPSELKEKLAIIIREGEKEWGSDCKWTVDGIDQETKKTFALDYLPWKELISYEVILDGMDKTEALCEIIHELTFYGTNPEEIEKKSGDLLLSLKLAEESRRANKANSELLKEIENYDVLTEYPWEYEKDN